ncbi:MAG TPA: polysaccharide deacetylase family protein [Usitatibacter sp.]|nr:polysaccharide deacetylase family protein [Usitatibacter sp.]
MSFPVPEPTAAPVSVLMYHAVGKRDLPAADPHYTVRSHDFERQLALIRARRLRATSVRSLLAGDARDGAVAITFDDGHESNARAAAWVENAGGTADFFVNPSTVGSAGFLDWASLRAMARSGHSIQSHGLNHRYLDELPDDAVWRELRDSKSRVEDEIGQPVTIFAPPGGRVTPVVMRLAREAGYEALCGSSVALWRQPASRWPIPRLAVTAAVDEARFVRWICQDELEMARMRLRYATLQAAKRVLGNRRYDRLREAILRPSRAHASGVR